MLLRGMSWFVIDLGEEMSYSLAAPQGVNNLKIIEKEQLATGNWQLARNANLINFSTLRPIEA